jgi:hypothetical protein
MSVDDDATLQYYIDKRYKGRSTTPGNRKRGVEDSHVLTSQDYDSMSLVDLCIIEKKNNLPIIPLPQNHFKCIISDEIAKSSQ